MGAIWEDNTFPSYIFWAAVCFMANIHKTVCQKVTLSAYVWPLKSEGALGSTCIPNAHCKQAKP